MKIPLKKSLRSLIRIVKDIKKKRQRQELLVKKAWDFTNLAIVWDLPLLSNHPDLWREHNKTYGIYSDLDDLDIKFIQDYLEMVIDNHYKNCLGRVEGCNSTCKLKQVAADLRLYLKNLSKSDISYWCPVWEGISRVDASEQGGDEVVVKVSIPLIGHMWE